MSFPTALWALLGLVISGYFCWRVGWARGLTLLSFFMAIVIAQPFVSAHGKPSAQWAFAAAVVATCIGLSYVFFGGEGEDYEENDDAAP